jgi:hypothetical protein
MQKLTIQQAQQALALHNSNTITVERIEQMLGNVSITFAQIMYVTKVQTAAAHKEQNIQKVTSSNVILSSSLKAHTSIYANKVKKSAATLQGNDKVDVEAFVPQANYFEHTACHSIVKHKEHADKFYLYAIYNSSTNMYLINGKEATLQDVAQYLTPSAQRDLLKTDKTVLNVKHNIRHTVAVRTIALSNIISIKARKQFITV